MARKTGKPKALELEEREDEEAPKDLFDSDLNTFLHDTLGTSIVEAEVVDEEVSQHGQPEGVSNAVSLPVEPQEGTGLPSLSFLKANFKTKSATIRHLGSLGIPTKIIAKHLGVKYQHARNVLTQDLKRGPNEGFTLSSGDQLSKLTGNKPKEGEEDERD